jgi:hypothetical protein
LSRVREQRFVRGFYFFDVAIANPASRLSGKRFGHQRRFRFGPLESVEPRARDGRLGTAEECGSQLDGGSAEREAGDDAAGIHDAASRDHGNRDRVDDPRDQGQSSDEGPPIVTLESATMSARLRPLSDDCIDTRLF